MKLEIKHLAPYLPYGLKVKFDDSPYVWGITFENKINFEDYLYPFSTILYSIKNDNSIKLILRPLSDLTKEITHNGKTFVPMVEIGKLIDDYSFLDTDKNGNAIIGRDYSYGENLSDTYLFFYDDENKSFYTNYYPDNNADITENSYYEKTYHCDSFEFIQKLFEWHFDVFVLIEKGLAIDINTI